MKHSRTVSLLNLTIPRSLLLSLLALLMPIAAPATITEIIDVTGDGGGNNLQAPHGVAVDASGNAYVSGGVTDNVFKITPGGVITQIIDATGDGSGNTLDFPWGMTTDASGNVYVVGASSNNVFKITPGGTVTEILDSTGDGAGNPFTGARLLAADASGNVYATAVTSHNVFKITPGGVVTEIIDNTGDGAGNTLSQAVGVAVDAAGNVYVSGSTSDNVFKITPGGVITQIIDATGDGTGNTLDNPLGIATDTSGNVYVTGHVSDNVFKVTPGGTVTEIIDSTGDGAGNALAEPMEVAADASGNVYVTGRFTDNAFKITPGGVITQIIDGTGDGSGNPYDLPYTITVGSSGNAYVAGRDSNNAFKIDTATGPNLSVATEIPAAELETVDVDIDFASGGMSVAATIFSIDYDESCLSFDDTDGDANNIPDAMTFHVPAGFAVTVFHDLGDSDGEIDVSITDLAPPIGTLGDGALVTITFTATCEPAIDSTIVAPVVFSTDPSATFGDDLGADVNGTTTDGSVEIWPGPRGDCNRNDAVTAADLIGETLEIFDGDGTFWADVVDNVPFAGSPVGCDANDDTAVDAGDISCTILLIFGGSCSGSPFADPQGRGFNADTSPVLGLERAYRGGDGRMWIPVMFDPGSHALSSIAFSLDLAEKGWSFDPFDGDGDSVPDSVRFAGGRPGMVEVRYDVWDRGGEIDLVLGSFDGALSGGLLVEIAVERSLTPVLSAHGQPTRFAASPGVSFGNLFGQAVPGRAIDADGK